MNPLPALHLHHTSLTVPYRLPVCSYSSGSPHSLSMTSFLCKNYPFPCTIPLWIGGGLIWHDFSGSAFCFNFQQGCVLGRAASFNSD